MISDCAFDVITLIAVNWRESLRRPVIDSLKFDVLAEATEREAYASSSFLMVIN
jgi:hypothetical protein